MSSARRTDGRWSLARRLATLSAVASCAMVALYAVWSAYYVFASSRSDLKAFLDHETTELAVGVARSEGEPEVIRRIVEDIAAVSKDPPCAFRVRDRAGSVLAESGVPRLLTVVSEPVSPETLWREHLWSNRVVVSVRIVEPLGESVEVFVDASKQIEKTSGFLISASVAFLVAAAGAGLLSWLATKHGLAGLSSVVAQAASIGSLGESRRIRVEGAPDEIVDVAAALNDMLERIDAGMQAMRTFTAGLAHELRSPLQSLTGEMEVTLLSDRSPDEYRRVLGSNLEDLHDLSDAVDNLVAYCRRADPGKDDWRRHPFDLAAEAEIRLARERRAAARAEVRLEVEASGDTTLVADREAILRVVRNLVGNALDWSPAHGLVTVRVVDRDDHVELIVEDEGPGVPPELGARIFEPFVSGAPQPGHRSGYGLGLAICKSVIDAHGGTLQYESRRPAGTRFTATIPRSNRPR